MAWRLILAGVAGVIVTVGHFTPATFADDVSVSERHRVLEALSICLSPSAPAGSAQLKKSVEQLRELSRSPDPVVAELSAQGLERQAALDRSLELEAEFNQRFVDVGQQLQNAMQTQLGLTVLEVFLGQDPDFFEKAKQVMASILPHVLAAIELQTTAIQAQAALEERTCELCASIRKQIASPASDVELTSNFRTSCTYDPRQNLAILSVVNMSDRKLSNCRILLHAECHCELSRAKQVENAFAPLFVGQLLQVADPERMRQAYTQRDAALVQSFAAPKATFAYVRSWEPKRAIRLKLMIAPGFISFCDRLKITIVAKEVGGCVEGDLPLEAAKAQVQSAAENYFQKQRERAAIEAKRKRVAQQRKYMKQRQQRRR